MYGLIFCDIVNIVYIDINIFSILFYVNHNSCIYDVVDVDDKVLELLLLLLKLLLTTNDIA